MTKAARVILGIAGLTIGTLVVFALREATLSTHHAVAPDSTIEVIVEAESRGAERGQSLGEMVEAQLLTCRLEVTSDLLGPVEHQGGGRFRAVLSPTLDQTDKRQFRGCMEDWVIDHVRIDVVSLAEANTVSNS